jgi:hypothetical protein
MDNLIAGIPWRSFAVRSALDGKLPTWNPHNFCGHPLLAFPATAFLYPPEWAAVLVGALRWERLNVILHHALALVFMYRYLRVLGLWRVGSLLGAVSFGLGAHMLFHVPWMRVGVPVVWLPLLLLMVERSVRADATFRVAGGTALAVGLVLLGSTPQIAFYVLGFTAVYALAVAGSNRRALAALFVGGSLGLLIYSGQYVLSAEFWQHSGYARISYGQAATGSLRLWQLPGAFLGGAEDTSIIARVNYLGVLMLLMSPLALWERRHRRRARVLALIALGAMLLSLGSAFPLHRLLWFVLPPVRTFRAPARSLFVAGTALCIMGAMGSERFLRRRGKFVDLAAVVPAVVLALALLGLVPPFRGARVSMTTLGVWGLVSLGVGALTRRRGPTWCVLAWLVLVADLYWYGMVRNRDLERVWVSLDEYAAAPGWYRSDVRVGVVDRFAGASLADVTRSQVGWERLSDWLVPNLETLHGLQGIQGYSPMKLRRYDRFLELMHGGPGSGAVDRHLDLLRNPYSPCVDLLRLRYLLWPATRPPLDSGLLPVAEHRLVGPDLPLDLTLGPCVMADVRGIRLAAEARTRETLGPREQVGWMEVEIVGSGAWKIPLKVDAHVSARGHRQLEAADFPIASPSVLTRLGVRVVEGYEGGLVVRHLAVRAASHGWREIAQQEGFTLYERVPRPADATVFPVQNAVFVRGVDEAVHRMSQPEFDPRTHVVLEGTPRPGDGEPAGPCAAAIAEYEPGRVEVQCDSPVPGYLFLGDPYYPGWRATVNGEPAEILPADVAFRAVAVPAGACTVVLWLEADALTIGLVLCGSGWCAALVLLAIGQRWRLRN